MRTANLIMNIHDNDTAQWYANYLRYWENEARVILMECPACSYDPNRKDRADILLGKPGVDIKSWFQIVRRTKRGLTIECKECHFKMAFTYRNLKRSWEYVLARDEKQLRSANLYDNMVESLGNMKSKDLFEKRGKKRIAGSANE